MSGAFLIIQAYVDEGQQAVLEFAKEKFGLGTPDSIKLGAFENLLGEEMPSSTIIFCLHYGEETVSIEWNINNKQIYSVYGDGIL